MLFILKKRFKEESIPENKVDAEIIERNYGSSCIHLV